MNVRATAKFVRTSPRKVGLVAAMIRGQRANAALTTLEHTGKRATDPVGKVLKSAIANAENNFNLSAKNLVVESVLLGPGPTLRRFMPRAQGRATPLLKRSSHITVVLRDEAAKVTGKQTTSKKPEVEKAQSTKAKEAK